MITMSDLRPTSDGLVPAVVQDARNGRVLMVAYLDAEALERTQVTGMCHFWSRSRERLWMKGETSGNTLTVSTITPDCDGDVVLVRAIPAGPVCHTGADTCFDGEDATQRADVEPATPAPASLGDAVDRLARIVSDRARTLPEGSYTAHLLTGGDLAARKVMEEAGELAFAAKDLSTGGEPARVVEEAADVVYHLIALLAASGVAPSLVAEELGARMLPGTPS